jgi:hypothetical protein
MRKWGPWVVGILMMAVHEGLRWMYLGAGSRWLWEESFETYLALQDLDVVVSLPARLALRLAERVVEIDPVEAWLGLGVVLVWRQVAVVVQRWCCGGLRRRVAWAMVAVGGLLVGLIVWALVMGEEQVRLRMLSVWWVVMGVGLGVERWGRRGSAGKQVAAPQGE